MKLVSITPVRNEAHVIGLSLRALLRWVDEAIVLCHSCTDETMDIAYEVARENVGRVHVIEERDRVWREMAQRQRLLDGARALNATHVAHVDADEVLTSNLLHTIRGAVEILRPGGLLQIPMPCIWGGIDSYAIRAESRHGSYVARWNESVTSIAFADSPALAWRSAAAGYDHHHREPYGARIEQRHPGLGGLMHLQFADARRITAKHALYKMTERIRWPAKAVRDIDAMYNLAVKPQVLRLAQCPAEWWGGYQDIMHHYKPDTEPWQIAECERLMEEYGAETFTGLDLFGVVAPGVAA